MRVLAVIPARGGSKGIPRKNLRLLAGRPLVGYAIEAARRSGVVDLVVVSTEDAEIAQVSETFGARVVQRPAKLATDDAPSEWALLHALDVLAQEGQEFDVIVFLQCTSPLTLPEDVKGIVDVLVSKGADTAVAVTPFYHFLWREDDQGWAVPVNHDHRVRKRRQELPLQYLETGALYAMKVEGFRRAGHRFFGRIALYITPRERYIEIDEPVDLVLAERLFRESARRFREQRIPTPVDAVVFDFDGVFTDNRVVVCSQGHEAVICQREDGLGLARLRKFGIRLLILSSETDPVVEVRAKKLGIPCLVGVRDKAEALKDWARANDVRLAHTVYVGNDINDLGAMALVGCAVAPGDAHPSVLNAAHIVLDKPGGRGAVRELCDLVVERMEGLKHSEGY